MALKIRIIIIFLIFFAFETSKSEITKDLRDEWLINVEQYLSELSVINGSFTQINNNGNISKGKFWIGNNQELRFEYLPPSETIIIIKNKKIFFKENKAEEFASYSTNGNPLVGIFSDKIQFEQFLIKNLEIKGSIGTFSLNTEKSLSRNILFLTLDYPDPKLRQWRFIDEQKKETTVFFSNIDTQEKIKENLFETRR